DRLASFEETVEALTFLSARRGTDPAHRGEVYVGFHPWKRVNTLRYGRRYPLPAAFESDPGDAIARGRAEGRRVWFWASKVAPAVLDRAKAEGVTAGSVEDGFLRSVGLGANLIDAGSLVFDDLGIYYDPSRPSRLETLIAEAALLDPAGPECARAAALRGQIVAARVTKYNVGRTETLPAAGGRPVVLVPGQVEDDASIERGAAGTVCTNLALLQAARAGNPHAFLIYKPHPDVEAGLRKGKVPDAEAARLADHIARDASAVDLLDRTDRLWTMTSLMGFEALLRGIPVTCLGQPFYAGWGLTDDHGPACPRRTSRPKLDHLVHAVLIAYPSYVDPVSGLPCPPELAVERLAAGHVRKGGPGQRLVSKAQGMMAALGLVWWR
ncbi:MAG: capsular polysaccharide biosynthesis protein, partial [Pseudomonadota bacterium]